jgi:hypothetical protein
VSTVTCRASGVVSTRVDRRNDTPPLQWALRTRSIENDARPGDCFLFISGIDARFRDHLVLGSHVEGFECDSDGGHAGASASSLDLGAARHILQQCR